MDIAGQLDSIVAALLTQVEKRLDQQIETLVNAKLQQALENFDYESRLNYLASVKLDNVIAGMDIDRAAITTRLHDVTDTLINGIAEESRNLAAAQVRQRLAVDIDIPMILREEAAIEIRKVATHLEFPERSVPAKALNTDGLNISGDMIKGGVIKKFSSTGIDDRSSQVQMTLLDEGVVIENKIVSMGLEVKGKTVLDGDLVINGNIPEYSEFYQRLVTDIASSTRQNLDHELFTRYSEVIFSNIREEGLDLSRITLNGQEMIMGQTLSYSILDSNLQRVGRLKDLDVEGTVSVNSSFSVRNGRIGVNTIDPDMAVSIWDQEVEVGIGKRERDTAWITTPRGQKMIISAGTNENIVIDTDGSVKVKSLDIGGVTLTATDRVPNWTAPTGTVAFNSRPTPGASVGWISLGDGVWSRFGILS